MTKPKPTPTPKTKGAAPEHDRAPQPSTRPEVVIGEIDETPTIRPDDPPPSAA